MTMLNNEERINFLNEHWGVEVTKDICVAACKCRQDISFFTFLENCTMCGGDWGQMLLTGIKQLYTPVYDAIPDDMGCHAFSCLCDVIALCGVKED